MQSPPKKVWYDTCDKTCNENIGSHRKLETDEVKRKEIISILTDYLALIMIIGSGEMLVGKWERIHLKAEVVIVHIDIYTRVRITQSTTAFSSRNGNGSWIQSQ